MSQIVKYMCEEIENAEISCIVVSGEPWFNGAEVASALGYKKPRGAVYDHVPLKNKNKLSFLVNCSKVLKTGTLDVSDLNASWISEAGLYRLVLKSKAKHAEIFQDWVCEEVLPSIRKSGIYTAPLLGQQIKLLNESDLHYKVMDCIRVQFPELHVVPGLGEMQTTTQQRSDGWKKGYVGGQPDLLILNRTTQFDGFAIELKTPKGDGVVSSKQTDYLEQLENLKYKTLVSNNCDVIVIELTKYNSDLRFPCKYCSKVFKSKATLHGHLNCFHTKRT